LLTNLITKYPQLQSAPYSVASEIAAKIASCKAKYASVMDAIRPPANQPQIDTIGTLLAGNQGEV